MASLDAQDPQLSDAFSTIVVTGRMRKIWGKLHRNVECTIAKAKMVEIFGAQIAQRKVEDERLASGGNKKYCA